MSEVVIKIVDGREREYRQVDAKGIPMLVGYGAQLAFSDLSGVDLSGLDMSFANLHGAELTFVNLSNCNLSFSDLSEANAIGADLRGANLRGAVTDDTSLAGADLRGATYDHRSVRGAFISDDLTPEYLATLGIAPVEGAKQGDASLLPVASNPELSTNEDDMGTDVESERATNVGAVEIDGEVEGRRVEKVLASSPLADLLSDATPRSVARSGRTSLSRGGSRDYSELLEGLTAGIAELTTSVKWQRYLDVQSKFHRYSPSNAMLIMMQNPYATRVAGYKKWLELGRQVMAKESALRILAPMTYKKDDGLEGEKTSEIRGFKMVPVFDISQTEGPDLPDVVSKLEGLAPDGVFDKLTVFAESIGFRVERPESLESGANGDTTHSSGLIRVVASNSEAQQAKTLAHEIAHALLHDPESPATKDLSRGLKELEAESAAYVVCTALGMDTSDYSFGYVAGWAGGGTEALEGIKASAGRIQKASTSVLKNFEVDEPAVEAVHDAGVEMRSPQPVAEMFADAERDVTRDNGELRVDEPTGSMRILVCEDEGLVEQGQRSPVELLACDTSTRGYEPLSVAELDVMGVGSDVCLEI